MSSEEPFNCHSGCQLLFSHIILSQTCSKHQNNSIKDSDVDNHSEKIGFANHVKEAKSVAGFPHSCQFRVGRNDVTWTISGCQDSFKMVASEVASFETNFFIVASTSEAQISANKFAKNLTYIYFFGWEKWEGGFWLKFPPIRQRCQVPETKRFKLQTESLRHLKQSWIYL